MELEIKHVTPYLQHNLKMAFRQSDGSFKYKGILDSISYKDFETYPSKISLENTDSEYIWMFKPYLYPLSYLDKEIEENGEKFVPIDEIIKEFLCDYKLKSMVVHST